MSAEAAEWKTKGNAALSSGSFDEAIKCYTKALELEPNHVFYSNRSAAHLSNNDPAKALEDADACIKVAPQWGKGYGRKGAALHTLKRYDEARQAYEEGLRVEPNNAALQSGLQEVRAAEASAEASANNPLASAFGPEMWGRLAANPKTKTYLNDPSFLQKLQQIQQNPSLLSQHFNDPRIVESLGVIMGLNVKTAAEEAEEDSPMADAAGTSMPSPPPMSKAESHATPSPPPPPADDHLTEEEKEEKRNRAQAETSKQKGNDFYKKKEFEKALECYNEAIKLDPKNMSYLSNRAAVYLEQGKLDECIEDCKKAIAVGRENRSDYSLIAKAYVRIGNANLKKGDGFLQNAIDAYESAQMENRTQEVDRKLKKLIQLKKEADKKAYLDPEKAQEAKERGNACFKAGDFPGAVKEYSEAIKRDPESPVYYANRAAAYTKLTSFMEAKADCEKALSLDARYVKAYSRLGAIQFFLKEYHRAVETYQKGLEIDPENAECRDGLQRTLAKINESASSGEVDQERAAHALADPEIQSILRDPIVQQVLNDMQTDPVAARKHMQNAGIMTKINKLIAAGIVQVGGPK